MKKFFDLESVAAVINEINIDTDAIIPKQFLKTIQRSGLGEFLFHDRRYDSHNNKKEGFILNKAPWDSAKILIAGSNFGCGSSREHAPWALLDFGIKIIVSESFADIFYNNCFKNGILPIVVNQTIIKELSEYSNRKENIEIKLEEQEIVYGNKSFKFELDPFKKKCLIEGLDDIALSLEKLKNIENFEIKMKQSRSWI